MSALANAAAVNAQATADAFLGHLAVRIRGHRNIVAVNSGTFNLVAHAQALGSTNASAFASANDGIFQTATVGSGVLSAANHGESTFPRTPTRRRRQERLRDG